MFASGVCQPKVGDVIDFYGKPKRYVGHGEWVDVPDGEEVTLSYPSTATGSDEEKG
jgi:hypothetical protein